MGLSKYNHLNLLSKLQKPAVRINLLIRIGNKPVLGNSFISSYRREKTSLAHQWIK